MKISALEYEKAASRPYYAWVLRAIGVAQFIGATWLILAFTAVFVEKLGANGLVVCWVVAFIVGTIASVNTFVLAEILTYLHAIRWNTDSYVAEAEKAEIKALYRVVDCLADNIEQILHDGQHSERDEKQPEDKDPFDIYEAEE